MRALWLSIELPTRGISATTSAPLRADLIRHVTSAATRITPVGVTLPTMNRTYLSLHATTAAALMLASVHFAAAQAVPPAPTPADAAAQEAAAKKGKKPLPKKVAEDMITLTPFEVSENLSDTYD